MNQVIIPHAQANAIKIDGAIIRQDQFGRYCLNDLHKASGSELKNKPSNFLQNDKTQELAHVLTDAGNPSSPNIEPICTIRGGLHQGTYVVKELVYAYAMWISPVFHLKVIRTFDALATGKMPPQLTTPHDYLSALKALVESEEQKQLALKQIAVLEPKAQALDTIADTENTYTIRECAKTIGIKEKDLIDLLLSKKWCYRDEAKRLQPYAEKVSSGVFINRASPVIKNNHDGQERVFLHMRITAFGLTRITGLVNKQRGNAA